MPVPMMRPIVVAVAIAGAAGDKQAAAEKKDGRDELAHSKSNHRRCEWLRIFLPRK
jgi:ribosomal protein L12E/L44/L45/RPP1/RPP2